MASKIFTITVSGITAYFKGSDKIYSSDISTVLGINEYTSTGDPIPLVTHSELVRCGMCTKLQVRVKSATAGYPPTTISVLCSIDKAGEAMAYFNNKQSPAKINDKDVLGANFKRDRVYL